MSVRLTFAVAGTPQSRGSKRHVGKGRFIDSNPRSGPWMGVVAAEAARAMHCAYGEDASLFDGPLGLAMTFTLRRPVGHYGSGANRNRVRPAAPRFPDKRPDCTKLLRGVEDALTGVVWRDDAQVVEQRVTKRYGESEGVEVTVWSV